MFGILLLMSMGCGGGVVGAERRERLLTLARESDRIALEFSLVAAGFAETDDCVEDGFESPIAWIKANCHMSGGAAADRVCAGEQLDRLDRSEAAVLAGEIGFAHFAHIARASAAVGERLDETTLLRHARKELVAKFRETCIHARHAADPEGVAEEEANGVEARYENVYHQRAGGRGGRDAKDHSVLHGGRTAAAAGYARQIRPIYGGSPPPSQADSAA